MNRLLIILPLLTILSLYAAYKEFNSKQQAEIEVKRMQRIIYVLEEKLDFYQKVNDKTIKEKQQLQNKSIDLTERLKDALKNKKCSDELVPAFVSDKLYERAYQIRRIPKNSF